MKLAWEIEDEVERERERDKSRESDGWNGWNGWDNEGERPIPLPQEGSRGGVAHQTRRTLLCSTTDGADTIHRQRLRHRLGELAASTGAA